MRVAVLAAGLLVCATSVAQAQIVLSPQPPYNPAPPPAAPAPAPPSAPAVPQQTMSAPDTWQPRTVADLILLDKLRAQPTSISIRVGQTGTYGTLTIAVKGCVARPPDLPQNAAAFLEITDSRGSAPVFRGWILSNTPSVSQFEHPVYDLRLAACK